MAVIRLGLICICIYSLTIVVCLGLTSFQQFFSRIMTVSGCDREFNVHFCSAALLKYHAPDT